MHRPFSEARGPAKAPLPSPAMHSWGIGGPFATEMGVKELGCNFTHYDKYICIYIYIYIYIHSPIMIVMLFAVQRYRICRICKSNKLQLIAADCLKGSRLGAL